MLAPRVESFKSDTRNQVIMDPALQQKFMEQEAALVIEEFLEETLAALFEAEIMGS